jgi:pimeloyl-ACP methyl ester carboxylesterase
MSTLPYNLLWRVPKLSERVAASLFLTPFGRVPREEPPKTPGRPVVLRGQRRVAARVYGEGRPVFLVHGWGGSGEQMAGFVDALVARGHQAVVLDLPAHGASAGKRTQVVECSDALLAAARIFGDPAGVIAHSFGASVTTLGLARGLIAEALVFVAPLPSLAQGVQQFAQRARLPLDVMDRAARLIEQTVGVDRAIIDLAQAGPKLRVPLLCVHDASDQVIPLEKTREVVESWPGARLFETRGLGHRRLLRSPEVIGHATAFLAQGSQERPVDLARALDAQCPRTTSEATPEGLVSRAWQSLRAPFGDFANGRQQSFREARQA